MEVREAMLIKALVDFYNRAVQGGLIENPAFNQEFVRWIIPLDSGGNVLGGFIESPEPKKGGSLMSVPRTSRAKVGGGVAEFLCDGIEAVFGFGFPKKTEQESQSKRKRENLQKKNEDFWIQIKECSEETDSPDIKAVLESREKIKHFLRWENGGWLVKTANGEEKLLKSGDKFTFQVNGKLVVDSLRFYWCERYRREIEERRDKVERGFCLVTGKENVAIQPSHLPKIQGVPNASPTGAALISFDKDAFRSYGFEQSYNAPVSFEAVEAYTNAMNYLLQAPKHHLRIGNSVVFMFWAERSEEASDIFSELFENPSEEVLRNFLSQPFIGSEGYSDFEDEQFFSVALSGNSGRIIVRDWIQIPVSKARQNFRKWFEDLKIVPLKSQANDKDSPFSLSKLAGSTVRSSEEPLPSTVTELYFCAILGRAPSISILPKLLNRIKTDIVSKNRKEERFPLSRFALLKLILNRNRKERELMIEYELNEQIDDIAYNCGRLLAIFGELQAAAHGYQLEGPGVVERYYGMASTAPNSAFPILWRLHQHHLNKLSREKPAWAEAYKHKIAEIIKNFKSERNKTPEFPIRFNLKEQGRFAIGFYQQIAYEKAQKEAKKQRQQETVKEQ